MRGRDRKDKITKLLGHAQCIPMTQGSREDLLKDNLGAIAVANLIGAILINSGLRF